MSPREKELLIAAAMVAGWAQMPAVVTLFLIILLWSI